MKILIIYNETNLLEDLLMQLEGHETKIWRWNDIKDENTGEFDCAILTGGTLVPITRHNGLFDSEISFIRNFKKPILGICLGAQMIAYGYESEIEEMNEKKREFRDIEILKQDQILNNFSGKGVYESHKWKIKTVPEDKFSILAKSNIGIEIIKMKERPVYGVQFHPEKTLDGDKLFKNFFDLVNLYS